MLRILKKYIRPIGRFRYISNFDSEINNYMENKATKEELFSSWQKPEPTETSYRTGLFLNNSLWPIENVEFIPSDGKTVNWYCCGPTVYTNSHLGHARCYLSNDTLRRIMKDYFGYDVNYVLNITDVDDKIIRDAKEEGDSDIYAFARKWEKSFFDDMEALNIEIPDQITRVTEFMQEIIDYIAQLISNGYAYEVKGSVYFDSEKYQGDGYCYPQLEPKAASGDVKNEEVNALEDKKNFRDFALWKSAKEGEPSWKSPWGEGRPGWHIECSAMIYHSFGKKNKIDIHSGGSDLKFPHHDNEIAQSQAFHKCDQWVNYFLHNAALYIKGAKMSRSEKNYTVIKDILSEFNPNTIRLLILLHKYDSLFNYDPETAWGEPTEKDRKISEFFLTAKMHLRNGANLENSQKFEKTEHDLINLLQEAKKSIHQNFCNNFNTPGVINDLCSLTNSMNVYFKRNPKDIKTTLVKVYYDYVSHIFGLMGFQYGANSSDDKVDKESAIAPIVDELVKFRTSIKDAAKSKDFKTILQLCDALRDEILPHQGVRVEDIGQKSVWKYQDKDELLAEIQKKKDAALKKAEDKRRAKELREIQIMREPKDIFLDKKYAKFKIGQTDDDGIPSHNEKGEEYPKKIRKKFEKDFGKHVKARDALIAKKAKEAKKNEEITEN